MKLSDKITSMKDWKAWLKVAYGPKKKWRYLKLDTWCKNCSFDLH